MGLESAGIRPKKKKRIEKTPQSRNTVEAIARVVTRKKLSGKVNFEVLKTLGTYTNPASTASSSSTNNPTTASSHKVQTRHRQNSSKQSNLTWTPATPASYARNSDLNTGGYLSTDEGSEEDEEVEDGLLDKFKEQEEEVEPDF